MGHTAPWRRFVFLGSCCLWLLTCAGFAEQTQTQKAWDLIQAGIADHSTEKHATAIRVLGLLPSDSKARELSEQALTDEHPEVRASAATALGKMRSRTSIPKLKHALEDKDITVALAAANALREMGDPAAYRVYYAVLTGELKVNDTEEFGFAEAIGFIPFVGTAYRVFSSLNKDDASPVRAAAAAALASDRDPRSAKALAAATSDESWLVRLAALDAIAHRGDPALLPYVTPAMKDGNDAVRFTAAASVIRLSSFADKREAARKK